jgi:hypothetical protein
MQREFEYIEGEGVEILGDTLANRKCPEITPPDEIEIGGNVIGRRLIGIHNYCMKCQCRITGAV